MIYCHRKTRHYGKYRPLVSLVLRNDGSQTVRQGDHAMHDGYKQPTSFSEILKSFQMPDSIYDQKLAQIKAGILPDKRISTMTVIIKATDDSNYKNLVDALDEMQICSIGKYVIDKLNPQDIELLKKNNVKF